MTYGGVAALRSIISYKIEETKSKTRVCACIGGLTSTPVSTKKLGTTASCKTCVGRPFFDGKRPVSSSMMSRVGLELTNFINPDLNWKTVPKSSRTGSRRSRKQATKPADSTGKMVEDAETTVSESEKLGVAVLGRRFSGKAEHVPLKKRKSMFRYPSPPPQSCSPSVEDSDQLIDIQKSRSQVCAKPSARKQLKTSADSTIKFAHATDFSGIEILADVACSNSIGDDAVIVEDSVAEKSKREVIDPSGATNCSQKDTMHEERNNDGMVKRLHWDLNLSMDAWEQPPEIDYQANSVEVSEDMPQISELRESQEEDTEHKIVHTGNSPVGRLVSSNVSADINTKMLIPKICKTIRDINKLEFSSGADKNYDKPLEFSTEAAENAKASIWVEQKPEVDDKQKDEHDASGLKSDNNEAMNCDVASPREPVPEKVPLETDSSILIEVVEESCVSPTPIGEVEVVLNADKADSPHRIESSTVEMEAPMHDGGCNKNRSSSSSSSDKVSVDDGYDSQFEDGELRETDLRCWDNVDGEAEFVDYGTDDNGETFDTDDYSDAVTGKPEMGSDCGVEGTCASEANMEKNMNATSDHLIDNGRSGSSEMYANPTVGDKLEAVGSKSSRKELQPSIDVLNRNDTIPLRRGRFDNFDDSYSRVDSGRDRPGGHSFYPSGGFRGSKRGHSPTYYAPYNSGRSRPRIDNAVSDAVPGLDNRIRRPFMNPSSNGVYRPYVRRRSPSEREDLYSPVRDISPERRRFRRYPQGINRGFRLPEDEYFNRLPQRRAPPHYPQPFRKSRSRSRSRSPTGWLLPRNRYRSRSPEFRSKGRVERTARAPFHRPGLEPGYETGPMSPPRNNSRWCDDRNNGVRRSSPPVRMVRPGQRFDSARPVRGMMNPSDDGFRPPGRYARKYDGSEDDRRKNGERYEVIHRVRRFDSDGPVRRFRYDAEDSFRRPRDVLPKRGSEEEKDQLLPRSNQDHLPRLNQDHQPRSNQEKPRWDQDHHPISNQEQPRWDQDQPRLNQDYQPRLNQEKPRWDQDHHSMLNQDQNLRFNQEQPRLNQNQQPKFNQGKKVNNASPESVPLLGGEAA